MNLIKLREGRVETDVGSMLPEADIAFLDEVFLGSTAILNTLLGVLNERSFRRHMQIACPLRVCVRGANARPDDESLAAFADRFLLHVFVDAVPDAQLEDSLHGGWQGGQRTRSWRAWMELPHAVGLADLAQAVRQCRHVHIVLSDRRNVRPQQPPAPASPSARSRARTARRAPASPSRRPSTRACACKAATSCLRPCRPPGRYR